MNDMPYARIDTVLYQWDLNRTVTIDPVDGFEVSEVDFGFVGADEALSVLPRSLNGTIVADIPNIMLQQPRDIVAYIVCVKDGKRTLYSSTLHVNRRPKPADYIYTETEVLTLKGFDERIQAFEEKAANGDFNGKDGRTPEKGVDYFTEADKKELLDSLGAPSGGGGDEWELINFLKIESEEEANALRINMDSNGQPFELKKARLICIFPPYQGESTIPTFSFTNINGFNSGANSPLSYTGGLTVPSKSTEKRCMLEVDVSGELQFETAWRPISNTESFKTSPVKSIGNEIKHFPITLIGGTGMLIYSGCKFYLYGVRI